jgi:hypothetical protein
MSHTFKTEKFKNLKEKWYKKLAASGFNDIEKDEDTLKVWESHAFGKHRYNAKLYDSKEKYFALAGQFLNEAKFESRRHKLIWKLHSEGASIRDIEIELKRRKYESASKSVVAVEISKMKKEMLDKYAASDEF